MLSIKKSLRAILVTTLLVSGLFGVSGQFSPANAALCQPTTHAAGTRAPGGGYSSQTSCLSGRCAGEGQSIDAYGVCCSGLSVSSDGTTCRKPVDTTCTAEGASTSSNGGKNCCAGLVRNVAGICESTATRRTCYNSNSCEVIEVSGGNCPAGFVPNQPSGCSYTDNGVDCYSLSSNSCFPTNFQRISCPSGYSSTLPAQCNGEIFGGPSCQSGESYTGSCGQGGCSAWQIPRYTCNAGTGQFSSTGSCTDSTGCKLPAGNNCSQNAQCMSNRCVSGKCVVASASSCESYGNNQELCKQSTDNLECAFVGTSCVTKTTAVTSCSGYGSNQTLCKQSTDNLECAYVNGSCVTKTTAVTSCSGYGSDQGLCKQSTDNLECAYVNGSCVTRVRPSCIDGATQCVNQKEQKCENGSWQITTANCGTTSQCSTTTDCTSTLGSGYICSTTPYGKWCVPSVSPTCGNDSCDINETVSTCPNDCLGKVTDCTNDAACNLGGSAPGGARLVCQLPAGICVNQASQCGNNICDYGETKISCPQDCGFGGTTYCDRSATNTTSCTDKNVGSSCSNTSGQQGFCSVTTSGGANTECGCNTTTVPGTGDDNTGGTNPTPPPADSCTAGALVRCGSNGQCCANGGVCQGVSGQEVCQIPTTSPAQQCADGGGTCTGWLGFRCTSLTSSGECLSNPQYSSDRSSAASYAGSCGQVDQVCVGGSKAGHLCGDFTVFNQCGGNPPQSPPPGGSPNPSPSPSPTTYFCNSECSNDTQCQDADSRFRCALVEDGSKRCRLNTNTVSTTCQPPTGPMCMSISMARADGANQTENNWSPGTAVRFTCGAVTGADHYVFRVIEPDEAIITLQSTGAISAPYTLEKSGRFRAQCQICTGPGDDTCHPFEDPNNEAIQ